MKRRLFATLISPAASYGCEVLGTHCVGRVSGDIAKLTRIHSTSLLVLCQLCMGTPVSALFAELGDEPWDHRWCLRVIRFAGQLDGKPKGDLHREIMHDNVSDARLFPAGGNWAAQIARQCRGVQLPAPFAVDASVVISAISYRSRLLEQSHEFWASTHISPRTCPSKGLNAAHTTAGLPG